MSLRGFGPRLLEDRFTVRGSAQALTTFCPYSFVNRKNNVPELQRMYQAAYAQHTRIWKIVSQFPPSSQPSRPGIRASCDNPRSRWYMTPFLFVLWGTFGASVYAMGRKAAGYNTWFSSK
ncbi:hypothetical protein jhhlp_001790 [Lomentospora prolificans]|uniref:Uncharacterized protein n=1 Tax=Lomentospora prolificans TaxID=41688 RepID=A0A2N3NGQ1_9PEZI|nr:hypothetical protein jhhlp_001790 [Lomentospora prolificans]